MPESTGDDEGLLAHALRYADRGWSVIAVKEKQAIRSWKSYQEKPPDKRTLKRMFSREGVTGVAVIGGAGWRRSLVAEPCCEAWLRSHVAEPCCGAMLRSLVAEPCCGAWLRSLVAEPGHVGARTSPLQRAFSGRGLI
jgi:hypothetical protein